METYYSFVFKGLLTEEALDKAGRKGKTHFSEEEAKRLSSTLAVDEMNSDFIIKIYSI